MKTLIFFFSILVSLQFVNAGSFENRHNHQLYYTAPATIWEETLPLGNGRLGMMPDGGVDREHIVLNEISLWSGMEADYGNPDASRSLPAIQQLLFEGKNKEAQELMYSSFVPKKPESGGTYGNYQMLADLNIDFSFPHRRKTISENDAVPVTDYRTKEGIDYQREYFTSRDKDVMIIHLTARRRRALSFSAQLSRPKQGAVSMLPGIGKEDGTLLMEGT